MQFEVSDFTARCDALSLVFFLVAFGSEDSPGLLRPSFFLILSPLASRQVELHFLC